MTLCVAFTLLGVFSGEMAIFLPGRLCILVLWGSDRVMVLGGIPGELWVRTRPGNTWHDNVRKRGSCSPDVRISAAYGSLTGDDRRHGRLRTETFAVYSVCDDELDRGSGGDGRFLSNLWGNIQYVLFASFKHDLYPQVGMFMISD